MGYRQGWRTLDRDQVDQVANRPDRLADLTPASAAPADQLRTSWAARAAHQDVPTAAESRRHPDPICD